MYTEKKEETSNLVPKYPHFLAVWIKLETFYFQIFCLKNKRKSFISVPLFGLFTFVLNASWKYYKLTRSFS